MTKEEFKTKYYSLNIIREGVSKVKSVEEYNIQKKAYEMQIDDLVGAYRQLYPYFKEAAYIRAEFDALLNSPDYLDYLHDNPELFSTLLVKARQIEELNVLVVPKYIKLFPYKRDRVQDAIRELLEMKDDKNEWFFDKQGYWFAVYEVLVEEEIILKVSEEEFVTLYCSDKSSPLYIMPRENDHLRNPYRIGALNKKNKPVNTANEMRKARRKEKEDGKEKFPNVDLFKDKFRELLVKNGVIKP